MGVSDIMNSLTGFLTGETNTMFTLLFFTAIIVLYSVFVYYFYQFLAKKNIIELNLNQYNTYSNPAFVKFFAVVFYILEYIVFLPVVTFFWFTILAILILILAEGVSINSVLLITTALVASVRATSYVSQNLSRDLAKMIPFTLLAIAITKPGFFEISSLIARISEVPALFTNVPFYLLFIVSIELIMRIVDFANGVFSAEAAEESSENNSEE